MSSAGSMNVSLNNNRKLLKNRKHKPFTKMNGASGKKQGYKPYVMPHLFPHKLRRVRIRIKRQNRRLFIKKLVIAIIGFLMLMCWIYTL